MRRLTTSIGAVVVCLASIASNAFAASQPPNVRFGHINREHGLSQAFVFSILQDKQGYLWFGTQDGLNRFDGYDFRIFVHDPYESDSIGDETVRTMLVDQEGTLWAGTDAGGLSRYNRAEQTFTNYQHDPEIATSIASNRVRIIYQSENGEFWVGTDGGGLDRFSPETGTFEHFAHDPNDVSSLAGNHVWSILENSAGDLFVATEGGLSHFRRDTRSFIHYQSDPTDATTLSDNNIRALYEDADRNLWVGTQNGGLDRFDYASETFENFAHDTNDANSISDNRINTIYQDNDGMLWVGTVNGLNLWDNETRKFARYSASPSDRYSLANNNIASIYQDRSGVLWVGTFDGVNRWNPAGRAVALYRNDPSRPDSLNNDTTTSFAEDPSGNIWVATYGGGLNHLDVATDKFRHFLHSEKDETSLSSNLVMSLLVDRGGVLWAGTRASGLNRYDEINDEFVRYRHDPNESQSISADGITSLLEDSAGGLWIGTFGGGLNYLDRQTGHFTAYRHDPDDAASLSSDRVLAVHEDSIGKIWIGTYGGGLSCLDRETGKFMSFRAEPSRPDGLSGDEIYAIKEDNWGDLWIGVKGRGLNRWRRDDRKNAISRFERFSTRDGLPSSTIYGAAWDLAGHLWLSTGDGLSRLDIEKREFRNFNTSHGLQDDEFNVAATLASQSGRLYFGGVNGFNAFYPNRLVSNRHTPQVAITKISVLDNTEEQRLDNYRNEQIELDHNENILSFEFAALDFVAPKKNYYQYMLDGLDDRWTEAGTKRQVTYSNIPAGEYTFRVRAANHDGVWSEQDATQDFLVHPTLWRTWWAYSLYAMAIALLGYFLHRSRVNVEKRKEDIRHAEELSVIKSRLTDAQHLAGVGNWEWTAQGKKLWWSDELYRLLRIDRTDEDVRYSAAMGLVHPDDLEATKEAIDFTFTQRTPHEIEHRLMLNDGTELIVHSKAKVVFDDKGEPAGLAGTVQDISARKRAEIEIQQRAEFQSLIAGLSTKLIQAPQNAIARELNASLEVVANHYALDIVSIWWFHSKQEKARPSYRWTRSEGRSRAPQVAEQQAPWILQKLRAGEPIVIKDIDSLPQEAILDRAILEQRNIASLLVVPLVNGGRLTGACAYATLRIRRDWSIKDVGELKLISEVYEGTIARSRATSKVEHLKNRLHKENLYLKEEIKLAHGFDEIIGKDHSLRACLKAVEKVAPTDVTTLILGETGTGKELIARAIHRLSSRGEGALVSVNCPALPATLIESELFGHEKGAFTGAQMQRRGRFELANGGTLFLDEIGDLPYDLQGKLLRVLQTGELQRIGGSKTINVDIRLIAATNLNLEKAIDEGNFRADLYYRICSFPIKLPPLRERKNDIPLLADHFIQKHSKNLGKSNIGISASMIMELMQYTWPGNIRELESTIERALISSSAGTPLELATPLRSSTGGKALGESIASGAGDDLFAAERAHILSVLEKTRWKIAGPNGAAAMLGLPTSTLRSKMKRLDIRRSSD